MLKLLIIRLKTEYLPVSDLDVWVVNCELLLVDLWGTVKLMLWMNDWVSIWFFSDRVKNFRSVNILLFSSGSILRILQHWMYSCILLVVDGSVFCRRGISLVFSVVSRSFACTFLHVAPRWLNSILVGWKSYRRLNRTKKISEYRKFQKYANCKP